MIKAMWVFFALLLSTVAYGDAAIFSGTDIKLLKQNLSFNGAVKILSGTADPTSSAQNAPIGSLYLNTTNGIVYKKQDAGSSVNWVPLHSGDYGVINYIKNPDAEQVTTGWVTYADAAGTKPVDGTGGAPTLTLTRTTTTPLRGIGSFLITKDAANRQGNGASTDITISSADQAKMLSVEFDYSIASGTYADGDLAVYIYDTTNSTVIQPAPYQIQKISGSGKFRAVFQTASNSTGYRVIIHAASTSAVAYTVKIDNVRVGPQPIVYGAPITDAVAYTPTFVGLGTVTSIEAYWRRIGDKVHVFGNFTTGTATAVASSMSLPSGMTTAAAGTIPSLKRVGSGIADNASSGVNKSLSLLASAGATTVGFSLGSDGSATSPLVVQNGSTVFFNSTKYSFSFEVEIAGWSSSVTMSNDADTRVVGMKAGLTSNLAVTLNTPFKYDTIVFDTHGAYSASTGLYTAPVSGKYLVSATCLQTVGATANVYIAVNGSNKTYLTGCFNGAISGAAAMVDVNAGDTIAIQPDATQTFAGNASFYNTLNIQRLSGPTAIAASEFISAQAGLAANLAVTVGNPIIADTKIADTHGAYSTSTGLFTVPSPGYYKVSGAGLTTATTASLQVLKNGVGQPYFATITNGLLLGGSFTIKCIAGDTLGVTLNVNSTLVGTAGPGYDTWVSFEKVGN